LQGEKASIYREIERKRMKKKSGEFGEILVELEYTWFGGRGRKERIRNHPMDGRENGLFS